MKLYVYDHFPFCIRAKMIFGLKNIPVEKQVLLNDDEATPIGLVGKKTLPILVKQDGTAMPKSLDIVRYVDTHFGQPVLTETEDEKLADWLKAVHQYVYCLILPRFVKLPVPEFAIQSAIDYFTQKKTATIGDFAENLAQTDELLAKLNADLNQLDEWIVSPNAVHGTLSMDDIRLFPVLQNMTCIAGVVFPVKVKAYLETMSAQSQVALFNPVS